MDVRDAVEEFLHSRQTTAPVTQRGYSIRLRIFTAWCEEHEYTLEQLSAKIIRTFIEDVSKRHSGLAPVTIRQYALTCKTFLKWCSKDEEFEDVVSSKVVNHITLPRADVPVIQTFSPEQLTSLLRAPEN